ncbi:MAG: ComEC/Rec2 family competence protein, partial [Firmicutes bacterium]|nr:ComEC/Rec2 family competence protein [Bacillota bacterium]
SLSALSLAVVIILIIFPVYLFDFGFLFSMTAVLGIILFMRPIQNFFLKCKFPKRAADSAALSISAQIGLAPAFTLGMRSVRLYSIPFNILIMPIVGFTFIALLISLLLTMLFSPLGILLSLSGALVAFLNTAAFSVALLPFAIIPSFDLLGGLIFLSLPLFFSASRFIMVEKKRLKAAKISVCLLTATAIIFVGIPLVQNPQSEVFIVSVAHTRREVTSVVKIDNRVYVLGDVASFRRIDTTLGQLGIRRIDAIILFELDEENARAIAGLSRRFRIGRIYLYEYGFNTAFGLQILIESNVRNVFKFCGEKSISSNIFPVVVGQNLVAFEMASMHGSVLFAPFNGNLALVPQAVIDRTFAFRAHRFCGNFRDRIFLTNTTITFTDIPPPLRQYSTSELGRFLFDVNYGRLYALPQR